MRLEILIQFIVPLTFLAIWALTSLLNRDAQPLPPRPGRPQGLGPGGPRPADRPQELGDPRMPPREPPGRAAGPPSLSERPPGRPTEGAPARTTTRPGPGAGARPRPGLSLDDAIVYLEGEGNGRPGARASAPSVLGDSSSPRGGRAGAPRRAARGRSSGGPGAATPPRSEPEPQRALSDMVNQSLARQRTRPLEITPLGAPMTPLGRPLSQASITPERPQGRAAAPPPLTAEDARERLASPSRLRETILLAEVLKPPLALRGRRPRP